MKKLFLSLFILFLSVGLFAETGYAGIEWFTKRDQLKNIFLVHDDNALWETIEVREEKILNKNTKVYYHFSDDLIGVSYTVPVKKTEELYKKLSVTGEFIDWLSCPCSSIESFKNEIKDKMDLNLEDSDNLEITMDLTLFLAVVLHTNSKYTFPKGSGFISIYNYNDDTTVYVIKNYFEGYTTVVYLPRVQDY